MFIQQADFRHTMVPAGSAARHQSRYPWMLAIFSIIAFGAVATNSATDSATLAVSTATSSTRAGHDGAVTSFGQRRSHNGRYSAEVVSASPLAAGVTQSWTVHLSRRNRRVAHASLSARAWMPETAEESPVQPMVRYVGGGDYRIERLVFPRTGWWNLALAVDGKHGTDSVAFNVILPSTNH